MENIKKISRVIATCGKCGLIPFGSIICSVVGPLAMYLVQGILPCSPGFVFGLVVGIILICSVIMQVALLSEEYFNRDSFVLDKISGLLCAFLFVPAQIKIMTFGFVVFHLIVFLFRYMQFRWGEFQFSDMPGVLAFIADDIAAGLCVNIFLHLMIWIVH